MIKFTYSFFLSFIVLSCYATFHNQFTEVKGGMNVWGLSGDQRNNNDYKFYSEWGVPDLQALSSDNRTFELKPNINAYAGATTPEAMAEWQNGLDGNRWMQAVTLWERVLNGEES